MLDGCDGDVPNGPLPPTIHPRPFTPGPGLPTLAHGEAECVERELRVAEEGTLGSWDLGCAGFALHRAVIMTGEPFCRATESHSRSGRLAVRFAAWRPPRL